jgi:ATP-dependent DNA ligase
MPADPLRSLPKTKAVFVEPMDCLPVPKLPEGSQWIWEIKLDGYRAVAVKSGGFGMTPERQPDLCARDFLSR